MTVHEFINPPELLPGQGFSHIAIAAPGETIYIAGQTAHQADGSIAGTSMAEQADAALANLAIALETVGAQPEHLVAMQIFVTDVPGYRAAMPEIGTAWRTHLGRHYPTVSLFGVAALFDPVALIEIVATAVIPAAAGG
jgi:enamine deaminase RidA (YjgF/YER057c/UK114 family)